MMLRDREVDGYTPCTEKTMKQKEAIDTDAGADDGNGKGNLCSAPVGTEDSAEFLQMIYLARISPTLDQDA